MPGSSVGSCGILYFAKGDVFVNEATISARRTRAVMPETPVCIVTDREVDAECFDEVFLDTSKFEWADTPAALAQSPFDRTIFLDSDTYLDESIAEIFHVLDGFDVAARVNRDRAHIPDVADDERIDGVPSGFPEIQSGVVAYRDTPAVADFLADWERRGREDGDPDQRSLRAALFHNDVQFAPLEHRYNCLYRSDNTLDGSVKVFHGALSDRENNIVDLDHARQALNASNSFRIHHRYRDRLFVDPPLPLSYRLLVIVRGFVNVYREDGLRSFILKSRDAILRRL